MKITQEIENALRDRAKLASKEFSKVPKSKQNDVEVRHKIMQKYFKPFEGIISYTWFKHHMMMISKGD